MSIKPAANSPKKKALYVTDTFSIVFHPDDCAALSQMVDVYAPPQKSDVFATNPALLADAQIIMSSWGAPKLDEAFLKAAPRLEAVFYAAGTVKPFVTDACWERDLVICSAWGMNAIPVAEFALAQIYLCLKRVYQLAAYFTQERGKKLPTAGIAGGYKSAVGLISLGQVGRLTLKLLKQSEIKILVYDPFVSTEEAVALGAELVSLDEIFSRSDVVSLHTPWLKETENMIQGRHFASMKPNAAFINTARGAVVNEPEMIAALKARPDIFAVLDVTYPEPPAPDSPLWEMPNILLTPHIAGGIGNECYRQGREMIAEVRRYLNGEPLQWRITKERLSLLA
ncbi:MAG: hydroxyacid dehydrogenase [Candidatus Sumerlaeota bacterium]|nr:hydroxyacid dehydrogenase [Candidatus Sumerlaeota bacterium]